MTSLKLESVEAQPTPSLPPSGCQLPSLTSAFHQGFAASSVQDGAVQDIILIEKLYVNSALYSQNAHVCGCLCVCECVYALRFRIVSVDKILCFINTLVITTLHEYITTC